MPSDIEKYNTYKKNLKKAQDKYQKNLKENPDYKDKADRRKKMLNAYYLKKKREKSLKKDDKVDEVPQSENS